MTSDSGRGDGNPGEFLARGRTLALIVAAGSIALVALILLLPVTMGHPFEGVQLLLWGSILLIATLIIGISLVYAYISRYVGAARDANPRTFEEGSQGTDNRVDITLELLPEDERAVYRLLLSKGGQVLQKDLRQLVSFSGPKVSRVLDRLERKGLVVRERHGMTNRVRLTDRAT